MACRSAECDTPSEGVTYSNNVIRIVLVGKTGVGKSASGNTILGRKSFESDFSPESLTKDCAKDEGEVDGQKVAVIDTPGLFDTSTDENTRDIAQCISYASPGPHIFLIVIKLGRYTDEEKETVKKIQKTFGEEADKYSMVLFTHGDLLKGKTIEQFLEKSKSLQELVAKCKGWYHVFNNELTDGSQVSKLLKKIKTITKKNGGSHYTNEMFQAAERAIEKEKQRILKEKEEERLKKKENMRKKVEEECEKEMREMERNKFMALQSRRVQESITEPRGQQEKQARQLAERKHSLLDVIITFLRKFIRR